MTTHKQRKIGIEELNGYVISGVVSFVAAGMALFVNSRQLQIANNFQTTADRG